jgi:hypothetical protein
MSRGYGKFLVLSQPPKPLYRKYSAVGRTLRKQDTVFSDTISLHTAALRRTTAHRRRGSAPQMTLNGPEYFLSCRERNCGAECDEALPLVQKWHTSAGPMPSVLTTGGGGQAGTKYRWLGGPEGSPNSVTCFFIFLGIITMCKLYKSTFKTKPKSVFPI